MNSSKFRNVFEDGPISPETITKSIVSHQSKTHIGAHEIFLGQVRADVIDGKTVRAIEYTAHIEMSNQILHDIRETIFAKYDLSCMHIYHSLGVVKAGQICLFVFVSSTHRLECRAALAHIVEEIKAKVPIFGKELFDDNSHQWKVNK